MFNVITIDVSNKTPKSLGKFQYETMPKIGEWVELNIEETGVMFEVIMVAHSSVGAGSDIFVKRLSKSDQARMNLCSSEDE